MKKVISFCVWGKSPIYNYGLYENALLLPKVFPGWHMVVYHTKTADLEVMKELKKMKNVEVIEVNFPNHFRNSMLRFVAGFSPDNDVVIFRDADSRLIQRDRVAVEDWLKTGKKVHVIRDHIANGSKYRISAGMWGVRDGFMLKENILLKYTKYFSDLSNKRWQVDEKFLFDYIYPLLNKDNSVIHSDFIKYEPWDIKFPKNALSRNKEGFIGMTRSRTPNASKKFNNPEVSHPKIRISR